MSERNRTGTNYFFSMAIRIDAIREGITLTDTAIRADIPRTSFYDRLHGRRSWDFEQLHRIADVLCDHGFTELFEQAETEWRKAGAPHA